MSNIFAVTSAINSPHGSVTVDDRLRQTLDTMTSIRGRVQDSRIALLELGPQELQPEQIQLLQPHCDLLIPLNNEPAIQKIYQCGGDSDFWVKTPGEIWAMAFFMNQSGLFTKQDRIFKISGRYRLSDKFDLRNHRCNDMVVKARVPAVQYYDHLGQDVPLVADWQYSTRLYSFCGSMSGIMRDLYHNMFDFVVTKYGKLEFADVEHTFYRFANSLEPREIPWIGVQGVMAPSGEWVDE